MYRRDSSVKDNLVTRSFIDFQYLDQIVHSQVLSKSLALCCARKLSSLLSAAEQMRDEQKQNQSAPNNDYSFSGTGGQSSNTSVGERYVMNASVVTRGG